MKLIIDLKARRIVDMPAIEAVNKMTERSHKVNKKVYIKSVSGLAH
jgi:SulP family sulfate permease